MYQQPQPQSSSQLPAQSQPQQPVYHTIRPKDTLFWVAQMHNTTVEDIMNNNPGINPYNLQVGSRILVYPGQQTKGKEMAVMPGPTMPVPSAGEQTLPGQTEAERMASGQMAVDRRTSEQSEAAGMVPGQMMIDQMTSGQMAPGQAMPGQTVIGQPMPGQMVPGRSMTGEQGNLYEQGEYDYPPEEDYDSTYLNRGYAPESGYGGQMNGSYPMMTDYHGRMNGNYGTMADYNGRMNGNYGAMADYNGRMNGNYGAMADYHGRMNGNYGAMPGYNSQMNGTYPVSPAADRAGGRSNTAISGNTGSSNNNYPMMSGYHCAMNGSCPTMSGDDRRMSENPSRPSSYHRTMSDSCPPMSNCASAPASGRISGRQGLTTTGSGSGTAPSCQRMPSGCGDTGSTPPVNYVPLPGYIPPMTDSFGHPECNKLHDDMRRAWTKHVFWNRALLVSMADRMGDMNAVKTELMKNPKEMADIFVPYFSQEAANGAAALLTEHLKIGGDIIAAQRDKQADKAKELKRQWQGNATNLADALAAMNDSVIIGLS